MGSLAESKMTSNYEDEQACLLAMQLASTAVVPMVLKTAIEIDLLEIMARAGEGKYLSPKEIEVQIKTKNPDAAVVLDKILRLLASFSVLKCRVRESSEGGGALERLYAVAPVCKYLTRNEDGVSMAALALLDQDKVFMDCWYYMKDAILEGGTPFDKAYGKTIYEYLGTDQKMSKLFNQAMSNHSSITMKIILETYNGFEGLGSLVDVGGGIGVTLNTIISKYPSIKGVNFDLPHVIEHAPTFQGVEHVGGDMFVSVPKGDAIFMKWICHNWNDAKCLKLLKNCYNALPMNGKMIVVECILPLYPDTSLKTKNVLCLDVVMWTRTPSGVQRTLKEFEALAKRVGFTGFRMICSATNTTVMEFLKNV